MDDPICGRRARVQGVDDALRSLGERYLIAAVGVSTFGPLDTDPTSARYGAIWESSDAAWSGVNLPALLAGATGKPVFFDYDVNAGALAEWKAGVARGAGRFVYLSVGTGVGGVVFQDGLRAGYAPQLGHTYVPRESDDTTFAGSCRFHGDCLQGLASGRAIEERWGVRGEDLPAEHRAWDLEARYLSRACANLVYTFSPERIVVGSSVGAVENLTARVNERLMPLLNGFLEPELRVLYAREPPVVRAGLSPDSSLVGAAILARDGTWAQVVEPVIQAR